MEQVNRWAGRPALAAGQPAPKFRAVAARQVDHPGIEFGIADAELAGVVLI